LLILSMDNGRPRRKMGAVDMAVGKRHSPTFNYAVNAVVLINRRSGLLAYVVVMVGRSFS